MNTSNTALCTTFRVGKHHVTITLPKPTPGTVITMAVEWDPIPEPGSLTPAEVETYKAKRNAALAKLGIDTLVVDL